MDNILGYDEQLLEVDGEYDYVSRSYVFNPIYEARKGYIVTQSIMMCRECSKIIKYTGGPGLRAICSACYPALKVRDFSEGHTHEVKEH